MHKFIKLILCLLLISTLTACKKENDEPVIEDPPIEKKQDFKDYIKFNERDFILEDGITCDWAGSLIEFNFEGKGEVKITTEVLVNSQYDYPGDVYFSVYLDNELLEDRLKMSLGTNELTIIDNLPEGQHNIKLVKQSHPKHGYVTFKDIQINGTFLSKPANKDHYLLFFGDSITTGYGLQAEEFSEYSEENGSALYANATKSYAYLTAQQLDCDYALMAQSGSTLLKIQDNTSLVEDILPYQSFVRDETLFDYEQARKPSLIVINLGTNDYTYRNSGNINANKFKNGLVNWLKDLQSYYPNVPIIFVVNMKNDNFQKSIKEVVKNYNSTKQPLYLLTAIRNTSIFYHPDNQAQQKTAEMLVEFIIQNNLLNN